MAENKSGQYPHDADGLPIYLSSLAGGFRDHEEHMASILGVSVTGPCRFVGAYWFAPFWHETTGRNFLLVLELDLAV